MLELSRRMKNLMNDAKMEVKVETISDKEEDLGDNSPPHLNLLRIGVQRQTVCPSTFLLEGQLRLNWECHVLRVVATGPFQGHPFL